VKLSIAVLCLLKSRTNKAMCTQLLASSEHVLKLRGKNYSRESVIQTSVIQFIRTPKIH